MSTNLISIFEQYVSGWKCAEIETVLETLDEDCIITECCGPVYRGRDNVRLWMEKWLGEGNRVLEWDVRTCGELDWIRQVKSFLAALPDEDDAPDEARARENYQEAGSKMNHQVKAYQGRRYLHITGGDSPIQREQDAIDIIALCMEHDTNAVLLDGGVLSDDFVRLRTGLAGAVLQKFVNYNIKAAAVIREGLRFPERFREMVAEYRNGNTFRVFTDQDEAVGWLLAPQPG